MWLRMFPMIEPHGKLVLKLMVSHCDGLHAFFYRALNSFDSENIAKILEIVSVDVNKLTPYQYKQFCRENGFMISYFFDSLKGHRD